ncbi:putative RNA-directed DNA polymerase [Tanacetum coccineum]
MSNHEQPTPSHPRSDVRNTIGKDKQTPQGSARTTSVVDLEEFCEKHYEKLLPIMADKYEYEKRKKEKLEEVKARLDFGDARKKSTRAQESAYSESKTISLRRQRRSRSPHHNPSVFTRLRRERSRSPWHEYKSKERRESTMFKRLGGRGRSASAHSDSHQESSRYTENYFESEDSEGGHWKSKSRRKKFSVEDEISLQPLVLCRELIRSHGTSNSVHFDFPENTNCPKSCENITTEKKCIRDPIVLHDIKQRDGESTEDFIQRRHPEGNHRQNFKKGGGFRSQHKAEKIPDRFTFLTKTPKEILALEKGKFKAPPPMTTPVEKRNANKFCEFHGEVGHNTNECNHLRKQIKDMLKAPGNSPQYHPGEVEAKQSYKNARKRKMSNLRKKRSLTFTTVDKMAHNSRKFVFTISSTNYGYWKTMIEPFLITNNLMGYVDGSIPCPSKTLSVTDDAIVPKENPKYPIWVSNDATFAYAPYSTSREYTLKTQLLRIEMHGDETPDAYLNRAQEYVDALPAIGEPVKDKDLVMLVILELSALGFQLSPITPSGPQAFYGARSNKNNNNNRSNNNNNHGNRNNSRGNNNRGRGNGRQPSANFANTRAQSSNASANWHSDTGTNSHVTPDLAAMDTSEAYYGDDALHVGNGKGLPILHIGSSKVYSPQKTFSLKNILHVPEISHNLLSVQKFCHDNDVFFEFHNSYFVVKDESTHTTLLTGPSKHGLYTITLPQLKSINKVSFSAVRASPTIWHRRLGHPHQRLLRSMLSNFSLPVTNKSLSSFCNSCPLGKSSKLPLFESGFRSNNILDLVYCDVWGPAPLLSFEGHRYFMLCVDHHSRYMWIYHLAQKSDVYSTFKSFVQMVERQFTTKLKNVQTDWGGEFRNLASFFSSLGIIHRRSCPHTSEQNGFVERRNRHVVETGLTLLAQACVPQRFWHYAFDTGCLPNQSHALRTSTTSPF